MKFLVALLSLVTMNSFANTNDLTVEVSQDATSVEVKVKTGMRSSMCFLETTKLSIEKPVQFSNDTEIAALGKIEVTFKRDLNGVCMAAFGPHRGVLKLQKGRGLPQLQTGELYVLVVNGVESEEYLSVK